MSATAESAARARYMEHGVRAYEIVYLGFVCDSGLETEYIVWYELENVAGVGEFLVEDEDVRRVLNAAQANPDIGRDGGVLTGAHVPIVLWHSHYINEGPSTADVDNYPEWVDVGMVYHAPSGKTTLYNHSGVISPLTPDVQASLTTG
jgi:hypothetical protein